LIGTQSQKKLPQLLAYAIGGTLGWSTFSKEVI
jgi:hypothetical protein